MTADYAMPSVAPYLARLLLNGPPDALLGYLEREFGVEMDLVYCRLLIEKARSFVDRYRQVDLARLPSKWTGLPWNDTSMPWRMWLKKRLEEAEVFPCGNLGAPEIRTWCLLHMGFLCLWELPEQLERLANEPSLMMANDHDTARSRVFSTPLLPRPIDRVAARVARER